MLCKKEEKIENVRIWIFDGQFFFLNIGFYKKIIFPVVTKMAISL